LVTLERVRLANERRVVFSLDYLPHSLFREPGGEIPLTEIEEYITNNQSMYAFFHQRLSLELHHGIAWIRPLVAGTYIAEKLQVPRDSSILYIEQVDYDANGVPIALADEYYVADAFDFSVHRSS
jgi:GntR family transcriptional regulator